MLRNADTRDAIRIAKLHRLARSVAMPWLPVVHSPEEDLVFFSEIVLPNENVRIVEIENDIAGFIAFCGDWLNHLYVHPDFWGRRFGSLLLEDAKATSKRLQLWTFQRNTAARAFYERHQFLEVERTDGAKNEERTPDVRMVWAASDQ
ncbi:MAG: GNAT family N-acetyltransferase [Pseudomonadota bacterium]